MDYAVARYLDVDRPTGRAGGACCRISMGLNLGMLGYFKYFNFFAESFACADAQRFGVDASLPVLHVVLPIGISFYTFQSMSYVIDVYRRDIRPTRNLLEFAAFVVVLPAPGRRADHAADDAAAADRAAAPVRPRAVLPGVVPDLLGPDQEGRRRRQPRADRQRPVRAVADDRRRPRRCWRSTPSPSRSTATSRATPTPPAASPSAWASSWP